MILTVFVFSIWFLALGYYWGKRKDRNTEFLENRIEYWHQEANKLSVANYKLLKHIWGEINDGDEWKQECGYN